MTALSKTILGVNPSTFFASRIHGWGIFQEARGADGFMLLRQGGNIDTLIEIGTIFKQVTNKEIYLPVDVTGFDDHQLMMMRDKAKERSITGLYIHGDNVAHAVKVLQDDALIIGTCVALPPELPREFAKEILAARVQAGCTSLLLAPGVEGRSAMEFLQTCAASGIQLPPVLHGILPKHEENDIDAAINSHNEVATLSTPTVQVAGVYANCSYLQVEDVDTLMNKLTITSKQ